MTPSFKWLMMPEAKQDTLDAARYLLTVAPETGSWFVGRVEAEMDSLCDRWTNGFRPLPEESATLYYSHPVFQCIFHTSQ
jgi:hypothetical protein